MFGGYHTDYPSCSVFVIHDLSFHEPVTAQSVAVALATFYVVINW
jgi:hypothetical protein